MNTRKQEFFARYGNAGMVQNVIDQPHSDSLFNYSPSLIKNPHMTDTQLSHIIRMTDSRYVREAATQNPRFNSEHMEQMLTDGHGDHMERMQLVRHPVMTKDQSMRMLTDPHEYDTVKREMLKHTNHMDVLNAASDMHHNDLSWSASLGILRNTKITKPIHDKMLKSGDGFVRFSAMKHPLATVADIQHYIDTEKPDDTEGDSFAVAKEMLEKKKLEVGKEAAIKELRAKGLMKEEFEPKISVSKAEDDDYEKVLKLEQQSKHNPWQNVESFKKPLHTLFVAKKEGNVVGYMYVNNTLAHKDHIAKMLVDKDHRTADNVVESKMFGQLTKTTSTNIRVSARKAFYSYYENGFRVVKRIPKHYKNGEDATHMIKEF